MNSQELLNTKRYIDAQICGLDAPIEGYKYSLVIFGINGTKTNNLALTQEQLDKIKQILIGEDK